MEHIKEVESSEEEGCYYRLGGQERLLSRGMFDHRREINKQKSSIPATGDSKCTGPNMWTQLAISRNGKKVIVAKTQWVGDSQNADNARKWCFSWYLNIPVEHRHILISNIDI